MKPSGISWGLFNHDMEYWGIKAENISIETEETGYSDSLLEYVKKWTRW